MFNRQGEVSFPDLEPTNGRLGKECGSRGVNRKEWAKRRGKNKKTRRRKQTALRRAEGLSGGVPL